MSSPNPETDSSSMFLQRGDGRNSRSPNKSDPSSRRNSIIKTSIPAEVITVKDFFDFMKTAYQVYEHLEGDEEEGSKINWEELTKLTVINHVIGQQERDLLQQTAFAEQKTITSRSDTVIERKNGDGERTDKRYSCSEIEGLDRRRSLPPEARVEMLGVWTEANLNCKLNDVINEGILDSILPYLVGYKKPSKTTSVYAPIIKKSPSGSSTEIKKPASFGGFVNEKESWDRLGRRKSSVIAAQDRVNQKQEYEKDHHFDNILKGNIFNETSSFKVDQTKFKGVGYKQTNSGDVEIHVCDEVKGLKKDFRCPQKLLISKMGYFADVTAGQRLEDMDISVHCDIQIFDWLMRWVKRDTILVADWPLLDPQNVVPILVSASFLQMEPLLHDCLIYCHAHMNEIVKTSTNLACLSDALLTRLAAMYTNAELEAIRDRKDKIQSRLYCKMILSLAEPVPETLRGHYATLATLFKCSKCNKLLGRHIAGQVPCQPSSMRIDRRGNVISEHTKDPSWSLNEYIRWLYSELRSWRRVYWRLWADCHFLHCQLCDSYFPAYQMEWCSHHDQSPHMFAVQGAPLAAGRYACCGERAYRFETLTRNTGCQFREHVPEERLPADAAVMELYGQFRDIIAMRPPQLMFPERLTRLVPREGTVSGARLQCSEVYWWQGLHLAPLRAPLGLLGRLYTSEQQFNPLIRPGSPPIGVVRSSAQSLSGNCSGACLSPDTREVKKPKEDSPRSKQGAGSGSLETQESSDSSEQSEDSDRSDEDAPRRSRTRNRIAPPARNTVSRRGRAAGRLWVSTQSARSNQDGQRRFEERAASHMRAALVRRHHHTSRTRPHPGGVYARLESEWRERQGCATTARSRQTPAARARPSNKYK